MISKAALAGDFEICVKALDLFVSLYGAEAGNLALRAKSLRGLYVGGGIAPKILDKLKDGTFMSAFVDKGRYTDFLAAIPVQVVLNPASRACAAPPTTRRFLPVTKRDIIICHDADELARRAAEQFVSLADFAIARSGRFAVALSGGSTPKRSMRC